jgi:hypothetical protein
VPVASDYLDLERTGIIGPGSRTAIDTHLYVVDPR